MRKLFSVLGTVAFTAISSIPAIAASPKLATETQRTAAKAAVSSAWPPETLTGTISTIDSARRVVTVKDATGVPFDMIVNRATRIKSGQREIQLGDLTSSEKVSVEFQPERRGDIAESIQVKSSS